VHPLIHGGVELDNVVHKVEAPVRARFQVIFLERSPAEKLCEVAAAPAAGEDLRGRVEEPDVCLPPPSAFFGSDSCFLLSRVSGMSVSRPWCACSV
jgi:hypothetical protein